MLFRAFGGGDLLRRDLGGTDQFWNRLASRQDRYGAAGEVGQGDAVGVDAEVAVEGREEVVHAQAFAPRLRRR